MKIYPPAPDIIDRLTEHRTVGGAPRAELEWLAARGEMRSFEAGERLFRKGESVDEARMGMDILLAGRLAIHIDRGAGPRRVMEWQGGDLSGMLPFSRMAAPPGDARAETPTLSLSIPRKWFPDLVRECPAVTAICVHVMLDRARVFNTSDWQDEKMAALGKLAAGLAHELNNPASAVARSGKLLQESIATAETAARALALARPTEAQMDAVDRVRDACTRTTAPVSLSPLERADREDEIAEWLARHGASDAALHTLVDTAVTIEELDAVARVLDESTLDPALEWVAAGCSIRALASENEHAASRISDLVGAMKRLTHMDRAPVPEPLDIEQGLRDTLAILGHKARSRSVSVKLEVRPGLPLVHAIGGELNQVWMNLIDNALDAVGQGGQVVVDAREEGNWLTVRVIDDGPGIPPENRSRVFDPFFTTKGPGEGTGLGLEVARARARGNGGEIDFDSRPGRTEFRVFLPLLQEAENPAESPEEG